MQTPGTSPLLLVRSPAERWDYVRGVGHSAMIEFLARAAKELREAADRKPYQVASSATDRLDPSTIWRFEKGHWPGNADRVVDLYAADLGIEPIEIWAHALALWREDISEGAAGPGGEAAKGAAAVAENVARLEAAAESPPPRAPARRRSRRADGRRKRAS